MSKCNVTYTIFLLDPIAIIRQHPTTREAPYNNAAFASAIALSTPIA